MYGLIFKDGWIAMDSDGDWYWFSEEPYIDSDDDYWGSEGNDVYLSPCCFKNLPKVADWRQSKQKVGNCGNLGRL